MKATIVAVPKFRITLTAEELNTIVTCSTHHYDANCNMASRLGGFLYGWYNTLTTPTDTEPVSTAAVSATVYQLDLCCKILEMPVQVCGTDGAEGDLARKLRQDFIRMLQQGNKLTEHVISYFG
jgi:hypothetical protein